MPDALGPVALALGFSIYDVSYAASVGMMGVVFVYTQIAIVEAPRARPPKALRQGFAHVPTTIMQAGQLAFQHRTPSVLLVALALFLMATNPVEVLWPTLVKPMLDVGFANGAIGALTATYFFSIAVGASLSPQINRLFKRREAVTLGVLFAGLAGVQIALAMQGGIVGFVAVFIVYSILLGASETPASSILHRCVADRQRSTLLSLRSMIQQLGAAAGLALAGGVAEIYSTSVAWMLSAALLVLAAVLLGLLAKRVREETA